MSSTINQRVRDLRCYLNMNQTEFGKKLAVSQNYLSNIEKGYRDVTEKILKLLCLEFNANENWLRTGVGEMFNSNKPLIEQVISEYNLDDFQSKMMRKFLQLDEKGRKTISDYIKSLIEDDKNTQNNESENYDNDLDIEAELESYRRELEAEKNTRMYTASQDIKKA